MLTALLAVLALPFHSRRGRRKSLQRGNLFGLCHSELREYGTIEEVGFIQHDLVWSNMHVLELALAAKYQFTFDPLVERKEHHVSLGITEILEEDWLPQQPYKSRAVGEEAVVRRISGNQTEIDIGIGISRLPCIRAAEESGNNTLVGLASGDKMLNHRLAFLLDILHVVLSLKKSAQREEYQLPFSHTSLTPLVTCSIEQVTREHRLVTEEQPRQSLSQRR